MGRPAKRRTSLSQDCIEWDDQGDLKDPRQLADPSFCGERPSSPDSATDNLTPTIPRKRRRKPLVGMKPAVSSSTTADTASCADDDAASSFHRMLFLKSSGQSPAAAKISSEEEPIKKDQELEENIPELKNHAISSAGDDDDDKFFADFTPEELAELDQTPSSGPPDPCSTNSIHSSSHPCPQPLREAIVPPTNHASAINNKTPTMRPPGKVSQPSQTIAPLPTQTPNLLLQINRQEPKLPPVTTKHKISFDNDDDDSFPDIDPDEVARKFRAATSQPEDTTTTKPNDTTTTQLDDLFDDDWNEETLSALEDAVLGLEYTRYRVPAVTPERR